jgi:putative ABC transport system permease protein
MLTNYIKIALRTTLRNKLHSFINIMGLSIGLACAILILLYIMDELSYDKHNSKRDRIYIAETIYDDGVATPWTAVPLGDTLEDEYPVVEETARIYSPGKMSFIDQKNELIRENYIYCADTEIFSIFDYQFIYGSPEHALDSPHTIVLSEKLAKKYFGSRNPVGKILTRYGGIDYKVKGVFKDLHRNVSFPHDGLITMHDYREMIGSEKFRRYTSSYSLAEVTTFILLKDKSDVKTLSEDFKRFKARHMPGLAQRTDFDLNLKYKLLTDYHLEDIVSYDLNISRLERIYFITVLGFLILAIACINYMNLATAKSMGRAKEVGVRKVLGADRVSLIRQFLCESVIITLLAMLIAIALVEILLPYFNNLVSIELSLGASDGMALFTCVFIIILITGITAGSYPAIFLSRYSPVKVLGKSSGSVTGKGILRKALVIIQYSISIIMIICMMLSLKQMSYIAKMDLGFNKDNVFYVLFGNEEGRKLIPVLEKEISKISGISGVSRSSSTLSSFNASYRGSLFECRVEGENGELVEKQVKIDKMRPDYIDLMGIKVIEGKTFDLETGADRSGAVLINETFARSMGWNDSAIGKRIDIENSRRRTASPNGDVHITRGYDGSYNVIGVIKDIRFDALYNKVIPLIIVPATPINDEDIDFLTIKVNPGNSKETIKNIKKKMFELYPSDRFALLLFSLEEDFNKKYQTEKMVNRFLIWSVFLCVSISCLGLFGLSSFIAESRTKEIGIRKVNGASALSIIINLTGSFLKLVLISSIIACPIAYYVMSRWFENFANRTGMGPLDFIIAICIAMIIAWLTVSFHSIKAAMADPVKALRYE